MYSAGIGLRSAHVQALLGTCPDIGWLEVHPENYFCGGMQLHLLEKIREHYPVSFHGVGLSLGSHEPVSKTHLSQLKTLIDRFDPIRVSDHASWSASGNAHLNDLLPLPYTQESLSNLCRNIDVAQEMLGREILLENPSTYLTFNISTMDEPTFMVEAAKRTGCGLLLDINNIYVQAHNHNLNTADYLNAIPTSLVQEIHLAGHTEREFTAGKMLIDTHNQPVCEAVWQLFTAAIQRFGAIPTLIEWDKDLPALDVLIAEAQKAEDIILQETNRAAA